jgi:hypothetical protein
MLLESSSVEISANTRRIKKVIFFINLGDFAAQRRVALDTRAYRLSLRNGGGIIKKDKKIIEV